MKKQKMSTVSKTEDRKANGKVNEIPEVANVVNDTELERENELFDMVYSVSAQLLEERYNTPLMPAKLAAKYKSSPILDRLLAVWHSEKQSLQTPEEIVKNALNRRNKFQYCREVAHRHRSMMEGGYLLLEELAKIDIDRWHFIDEYGKVFVNSQGLLVAADTVRDKEGLSENDKVGINSSDIVTALYQIWTAWDSIIEILDKDISACRKIIRDTQKLKLK